ncbi:O-antigen ligase family protein [Methylacidiphilales bacterium]|nr:O-antigen ligase family protein [Candidatus Methylacidiphilales bacterium]
MILILTYSRGGWAAYGCGLAFLAVSARQLRRICAFCAIGFLLGVILIPKALDRAGSVADQEDRSITNRIAVWKGALAMTAAHPLTRLHSDFFGTQFSAWYQPIKMNTKYGAALNNYLTISAERGSLCLAAYLLIIFVPLWISFRFAKQRNDVVILGACAGLIVYSISALFTCSLNIWYINVLAGLSWLILIFYIAYLFSRTYQPFDFRLIVFPTIACLILTASIFGVGSVLLAMWPTKTILFTFDESQQKENGVIIYPQHRFNNGVILYFHDKDETNLGTGKSTLRPLAEEGFIVVSIDYRLQGRDGLNDACALLKWASLQSGFQKEPIFLCGSGLGGRISILAACRQKEERLKAVEATGADVDWPLPDLSPLNQITQLSVPLLLLYGKDDGVDISEPEKLLHEANQQGKYIWFSSFI